MSPSSNDAVHTLHLIANPKSGKGLGAALPDLAQRLCQERGVKFVLHEISEPGSLDRKAEDALKQAKKEGGIVVAAGGDGTIRSVAAKLRGQEVRFGVVPIGTFNFFARNHRIPEDPEAALQIALGGRSKAVRLGEINGHIFLINASLGLYAKAIRDREHRTSRWGRNRVIVILSTIMSLLEGHRALKVDMVSDKVAKSIATPMIFIGNNALQLRNLSLDVAQCMKQDLLAVVTMKPLTTWGTIKLIFMGMARSLENQEGLDSFCVETLTIKTRKKTQVVALDGEMFKMTSPLVVTAQPQILNLIIPPPSETA